MQGDLTPTAATVPEFLSVEQLAEVLGVPRSTLYDAIRRGEIPGVRKIGRHLRASRSVVLAWFQGDARTTRTRR